MGPFGVYFLLVCAGTLWVAYDARRFDWHGSSFCDQVWKWVVGCVFVFGIAFPAYLWQRSKAPARGSTGFAPATPSFAGQAVAASTSHGDVAIERAVAELSGSAYTPPAKPPLIVSRAPATLARSRPQGSLGLALLAGAAVALAGGLLWAGVVIATRWDIGVVAWIVGAATGGAVLRVFGGPVPDSGRVAAGLMAAGGILVGKYVIFVHDFKHVFAGQLAQQGLSVGYLDTRMMHLFIHHFGSLVRPIYVIWILFALAAAVRVAGGRKSRTGRR